MRQIVPEPSDAEWIAWCAEARRRTSGLKEAAERGEPRPAINDKFYKTPRKSLLRFTNEKCAYCEQRITANGKLGDIDHYRPKGAVKDAEGKPVRSRGGEPHGGYWWLAYDPENMLPSCIGCNRLGSAIEGRRSGKWDRFPVVDTHATVPSEVPREMPLLINPWVDDPAQHLVFRSKLGIVGARSPRGRATIDILDLNRERLVERRRKLIFEVRLWFADAARSFQAGNDAELRQIMRRFADFRSGREELSATALAQLELEAIRKNQLLEFVSLALFHS